MGALVHFSSATTEEHCPFEVELMSRPQAVLHKPLEAAHVVHPPTGYSSSHFARQHVCLSCCAGFCATQYSQFTMRWTISTRVARMNLRSKGGGGDSPGPWWRRRVNIGRNFLRDSGRFEEGFLQGRKQRGRYHTRGERAGTSVTSTSTTLPRPVPPALSVPHRFPEQMPPRTWSPRSSPHSPLVPSQRRRARSQRLESSSRPFKVGLGGWGSREKKREREGERERGRQSERVREITFQFQDLNPPLCLALSRCPSLTFQYPHSFSVTGSIDLLAQYRSM